MMTHSAIIIPARYGSTRFPGKPLAKIAGISMLHRVCSVAMAAAAQMECTQVIVATEDQRIIEHVADLDVIPVLTDAACLSGTDRVFAALQVLKQQPDFVFNLQGDAPFTPADFIIALWQALQAGASVATPVVPLSWSELDTLRVAKQTTPMSGTTVTVDKQQQALWFSKMIIPAIRGEERLRQLTDKSPILQHIGLYAYSYTMLETYIGLPQTQYEQLEGLEQLRLLEHGYPIQTVLLDNATKHFGIDTPQDLQRAEQWLAQQ